MILCFLKLKNELVVMEEYLLGPAGNLQSYFIYLVHCRGIDGSNLRYELHRLDKISFQLKNSAENANDQPGHESVITTGNRRGRGVTKIRFDQCRVAQK